MEDYKENKLNLNKQQVTEYINRMVKDCSEEELTWNEKITYLVGNMMSCFSQVENATFIKVLENLVKRNIFDDEYQRKLFLSIAIVSSNSNDIQQRWSRVVCTSLEGILAHLVFSIEIQSNNLMYNPNKEIRDRVFPVKIGKFSVKYYTF